jgi:hypothetical protein
MKRWMISAYFRRSVVVGAVVCAGASAFSCSPAGVDSKVEGGTNSTGATTSGGSGSTTAGSGKGASGPIIGGDIPKEMPDGPCMGLECQVPACTGAPTTSITGKVYDPAGKVPLYNVMVYVPNAPVPAFTEGAACDRCGASITNPVTAAVTDETGSFKLDKAPAGPNIPLVIQVGKWRRQITIPNVAPCADTALTDPQVTRLPRNKAEGDIPKIAIAAGSADQMECLPIRLGIDPAEFTAATGDGRIHLFTGHYDDDMPVSTLASGGTLTSADTLWADEASLMKYDIVILSCEGNSFANQKPMPVREAMYSYASKGGRVFASHWHNVWFANGPNPVPSTGTWDDRRDPTEMGAAIGATINETFPKGAAFAKWLVNVGASTTQGQLTVTFPRDNLQAVNPEVAREWITIESPEYPQSPKAVQYMSFNTPIGVPEDQVCGRAVYTDLHVAGVDNNGGAQQMPFPTGCEMRDLSAQEKAVAFMLFDLSSCVQNDDDPPQVPK